MICYVQASCFSLLSVTFLLVRVAKCTSQARPAYLVAGATGLWCLTSTTIILFQRRLPAPWRTRPHSRCIDIYSAWVFITASRSLLEASNVAVAVWLTWNLRMPVRSKITIVAMFALRLLILPPAVARLRFIKISWHSADWSYARVDVQILTQVAVHVSTILATVPCVKNFLLVFESGNLHPPHHTQDSTGRRVSKRRSSTYHAPNTTSAPSTARARARAHTTPARRRRARSDYDLLRVPTATRPGPVHTLRMNSWSAPSGLREQAGAVAVGSLSTAEHDPEDARVAAAERRKSKDSEESRRRIQRTRSWVVDRRVAGGEAERRGSVGGGRGGVVERQGSLGSCWSFERRASGAEEIA